MFWSPKFFSSTVWLNKAVIWRYLDHRERVEKRHMQFEFEFQVPCGMSPLVSTIGTSNCKSMFRKDLRSPVKGPAPGSCYQGGYNLPISMVTALRNPVAIYSTLGQFVCHYLWWELLLCLGQ